MSGFPDHTAILCSTELLNGSFWATVCLKGELKDSTSGFHSNHDELASEIVEGRFFRITRTTI